MGFLNGGQRVWYINSGVKALDPSTLPRCQAIATSTGKVCKRPALKGRSVCGIHAGRYKPGARANNTHALRHGLYTREAKRQRAAARLSASLMAHLSEALNSQVNSVDAENTSFNQTITRKVY